MNNFACAFAAAALAALGCSTDTKSLAVGPGSSDATVSPARGTPADFVPAPTAADAGAAPSPEQASDAAVVRDPTAPGADASSPTTELGDPRCGPPPYHLVRVGARDMMGASDAAHLAGVAITLSHCPEARFQTGPDGRVMLGVSRGAATSIRFDAPGYVPWMVGELTIDESLPPMPLVATMIPTKLAAAIVPGLRSDAGLVYLEVQTGAANGPAACRSPDGVAVTVKDHPEVVVSYREAGSNSGYAKAAMTSVEGVALIAGLPATGTVELVASKPGCEYRLAYGNVNSRQLTPIARTPLAAGAITHQVFNPSR